MTVGTDGRPGSARQRLLQVLACSALGPGLDGVLLFDLEPELVAPVADLFAQLLRLRGERPVRRLTLGSVTGDEELWLRPRLRRVDGRIDFALAPGPLVDTEPGRATLVTVPDLARLSLPGMRAALQLLGADVASVERSGFRARWQPRARWLAACREAEVGPLSPHLLDRFPVRLNAAGLRAEHLPGLVGRPDDDPDAPPARRPDLSDLPEGWARVLTAPQWPACPLTEEAAGRAVALTDGEPGGRRALGLARMGRALALFAGDAVCGPERVEEAARLIGLAARPVVPPGPPLPQDLGPLPQEREGERPPPEPPRPEPGQEDPWGPPSDGRGLSVPLPPPENLPQIPVDPGQSVGSPFPEDDPRQLREAPLRIPWQRRPERSTARGPVIGVRPATSLRDLAVVASVIEAAKHQNLPARRALRERGDGRLVVLPGDFRSYVRLPAAERMLVLLLDHTCRRDWDWLPALAPYLQWAYAGRASVCVVEVGGRDAPDELRAEHFVARSVLDPRVGRALQRAPGRSSPLAHGLALTDDLLRRAFQQRSNLVEAWLVVVSDGRGNVPLEIGPDGTLPRPVRRGGVEDALSAAGRIGAVGRMRLHCVVVDAARPPYADLTFRLAEALGGVTVAGRTARGVSGVR